MNTPNKLTLARIVLSPVFMVFFLMENVYCRVLSMVIFIVAALTDVWDGHLARKYNITTGFGKFMDPLADKILTSTAFVSFLALGYVKAWMIMLIIIREFIITGLRSLAAYRGMIISPTMSAKFKTVLQMTTIVTILLYINLKTVMESAGYSGGFFDSPLVIQVFDWMMLSTTVVTVLTGIDYLIKNGSIIKEVLK
ncbi:MAG: CDP-diacylglycerol--glycerol-3-phosphate 3-phosphatidyltransferase [candidate division Zixibacteria bacterium]